MHKVWDFLFSDSYGIVEGGCEAAKKCPVDTFLARGRFHLLAIAAIVAVSASKSSASSCASAAGDSPGFRTHPVGMWTNVRTTPHRPLGNGSFGALRLLRVILVTHRQIFRYSSCWPLMISLNSRPSFSAALRHRSIRCRKISKYSMTEPKWVSTVSFSLTDFLSSSIFRADLLTE